MGPRIRGVLIEDAEQEVMFLRNAFASIGTRCRSNRGSMCLDEAEVIMRSPVRVASAPAARGRPELR